MKILVFTDSRGQHKPIGSNHEMFGELLSKDSRLDVDLFLCPMKWTTTLDFLEMFPQEKLASYDAVILYTGIVDWSPRPQSSAFNDLYYNLNTKNEKNIHLNTRNYKSKVINNKSKIFNSVFGEDGVIDHLSKPFLTPYNGEPTVNMYSLHMAEKNLVHLLSCIKNLIFINSNRFVRGWEGDYKKERPDNMYLTHNYSDLFSENLQDVIDLRDWSPAEVMRFTCDNLHLTESGNAYIYRSIMKSLEMKPLNTSYFQVSRDLNTSFKSLQNPERLDHSKRENLRNSVRVTGPIATLVIGLRLNDEDPSRIENLRTVLDWLDYYYGDLFDVLLVEQDKQRRLSVEHERFSSSIRYEFIYNPKAYNRGWGYNVAVRHFCKNSSVVVLMDTDVLPGRNFLREVLDCHSRYDAISPYQNIYYSTENETLELREKRALGKFNNPGNVKNPVTLSGGILIIKRATFLQLSGFEQYMGYCCEDRAFDVTLLNHVDNDRIRMAPHTYFHLYHETDGVARANFEPIYEHLKQNYGCSHDPRLSAYDFIHSSCNHAPKELTLVRIRERAEYFGDPNLYKDYSEIEINGKPRNQRKRGTESGLVDVIYPDSTDDFQSYKGRELYQNSPEHDALELTSFYNAYKGKRCFIIGNGPSLNKHDLSKLENEYSFGVNSFYYKTRETGFTPFFYVVEDSSVMRENIEEIRRYDAPFKFFPSNYKSLHPKQPNTFFFRMNRGFYEKTSPNYVVPRFSTDASDVLYCGQSVTYINLQLAFFMGFEEVYLIGMDFDYVIPDSHKRTGDVLLSDTDDLNHFHKDYFGKGKTWKDPKLERVALNYKQAKLAYEATGRRVFNATIGGKLEIFPRAEYDALFHGGRKSSGPLSKNAFKGANLLYRQKNYAGALTEYVKLIKGDGNFAPYKKAAVIAYMDACSSRQICNEDDVSFIRNIM